jgi:uncharacterized membrane protein YbhN (UPF0104 family)
MENFTNSILLPDNLPEIVPEDFNRLDKRYLKIIFIRIAVFALVLAAGLISLIVFAEEKPPGLILAALITGIAVINYIYHRHFRTWFSKKRLFAARTGYFIQNRVNLLQTDFGDF